MSVEGGVMPSDVAQDATAQRGITPLAGKGALGTWRALCLAPDSGPDKLSINMV